MPTSYVHMSHYSLDPTDEMRERAQGFVPPEPPEPMKSRKGHCRVGRVMNLLAEQGVAEVSSWQVYCHLVRHGLADIWSFRRDKKGNPSVLAVTRTMSDILGGHVYGLTELRKEENHGTWWRVEPITEEFCAARNIDPTDPDSGVIWDEPLSDPAVMAQAIQAVAAMEVTNV